jgi:cytochrome b6-f complex iron-sulfur subunit
MKQNRREFIKSCGLASAGILCGGSVLLLEGCGASIRYLPFETQEDTFVVKKADFMEAPFAAIKSLNLPAPIYIHKLDEDNYSALLMECTHKQCELSASGEILVCPCHGSEFSNTGEVLNPPAEKPLYRFAVRVAAENIYIKIS